MLSYVSVPGFHLVGREVLENASTIKFVGENLSGGCCGPRAPEITSGRALRNEQFGFKRNSFMEELL